MTVQFRDASTAQGTGSTITLSIPSDIARNDVLLFVAVTKAAVTVLETSPAFTSHYSQTASGSTYTIAYARVGSSNPANYEFTLASSVEYCAAVLVFRNGVSADPIDVSTVLTGVAISSGGSTLYQSPGDFDSPSEDNTLRVVAVMGDATGTTALTHGWTGPSERVDIGTSNRLQLAIASWPIHATPGAADAEPVYTPICSADSYTAYMALLSLKSGDAPTITTVDPDYGPITGGETITITGTGFKDALTEVEIADVACTSVTVVSSTVLTAVTPAGSVGAQTLAVYTDEGSA